MGGIHTKSQLPHDKCQIDGTFCGRINSMSLINRDNPNNEVIFAKTYSYPKGTYSLESTKFFNESEKSLFYFSEGNNIAAVRFLTIKGVHISILDQDRTSPLHIACKSGSLQLVEEILNQGAMINLPDIVGWSALHVACYYKRQDVTLLLLKHGANLNTKDRDGVYPIDLINNDQACLDIINNFIIHSYNTKENSKLNQNQYGEEASLYDDDFRTETQISQVPKDTITISNHNSFSVNANATVNATVNANNNKSTLMKNIALYKNKILNRKLNNNTNNHIPKSGDLTHKTNHRSFFNEEDFKRESIIDDRARKDQKKILDKYKVIPKKHKFYMNYKNNLESKTDGNNKFYGKTHRNNQEDRVITTTMSRLIPIPLPSFRISNANLSNNKQITQSSFHFQMQNNKLENVRLENALLRSQTTEIAPNLINFGKFDSLTKESFIQIANPLHTSNNNNNLTASPFSRSKEMQTTSKLKSSNNNNLKKNSIVKIPNSFPETHNLKSVNESNYTHNFSNFSNLNYNNFRNSYDNNNQYHHQFDNLNDYKSPREVFSDGELEIKERFEEKTILTDKSNNYNFISHSNNHYNVDNDSEKYKMYDSMTIGSEDSFVLDTSMIKETATEKERMTIERKSSMKDKDVSLNINHSEISSTRIPRTRNKSFGHKIDSTVRLNSDEDTICLQPNDEECNGEDSIVFSEEYANIRPRFFFSDLKKKVKDNFTFNDQNLKISTRPETEYFLSKIKFSEIFFKIFKIDMFTLQSILVQMFNIDSSFSILFTLNVCNTDNNFEKLINSIRKNINNKDLLRLILIGNPRKDDESVVKLKSVITGKFFDSFNFEKYNLKESIKKSFKYFNLDNNIITIDTLSKIFAKSYFNNLAKYSDCNFLQSEHSIYMLVFTLILIDMELKELKQTKKLNEPLRNSNLNKKFVDMMVILKNLNDGENFDSNYMKDNFKFSKLIGMCNINNDNSPGINTANITFNAGIKPQQNNYITKKQISLYKNGKYKPYFYTHLNEGIILLFLQKDSDVINKMIYLKNEQLFDYKFGMTNFIFSLESRQQKKNILIFNNKLTYIKYKKHNSLVFKFENDNNFKEIYEKYSH